MSTEEADRTPLLPSTYTQGFLRDQGLAVDDGVDGIAAGLQALLGGGSSDDEEEGEEGEDAGGKKGPAFVTERYTRTAMRKGDKDGGSVGPEELELNLASSHHSLWGPCRDPTALLLVLRCACVHVLYYPH